MGARHRPRDADRHGAWARSTAIGAPCASWRENLDCPVLVVHGDRDKITPPRDGRALARLGDGRLEVVHGAGHFPHARKPVQVNLALRDFSEDAFGRRRTPRDPTVYRPDGRPRALYISSPIGLGHAQRDVAIARELRRLHPDLADRLARPGPGHPGAGGRGRAHPPRQRSPGERVAPHRVGVRRARPALLPGAAPHGRDPRRQLHALPRRRARRALRPVDRRRGVGARLLPAREPSARSASRSPG